MVGGDSVVTGELDCWWHLSWMMLEEEGCKVERGERLCAWDPERVNRTDRWPVMRGEKGKAPNNEVKSSSQDYASPTKKKKRTTTSKFTLGCLEHSICVSMEGSYRHGWVYKCFIIIINYKGFKGKKIPKGIKIFWKAFFSKGSCMQMEKPWHLIDFSNRNDIVFSFRLCSGALKLWKIDRQALVRGNKNGSKLQGWIFFFFPFHRRKNSLSFLTVWMTLSIISLL